MAHSPFFVSAFAATLYGFALSGLSSFALSQSARAAEGRPSRMCASARFANVSADGCAASDFEYCSTASSHSPLPAASTAAILASMPASSSTLPRSGGAQVGSSWTTASSS